MDLIREMAQAMEAAHVEDGAYPRIQLPKLNWEKLAQAALEAAIKYLMKKYCL